MGIVEKLDRFLFEAEKDKKWVYGTKDNKWHLVGPEDRDYKQGISQDEFKKIGKEKAKKKYLSPGFVKEGFVVAKKREKQKRIPDDPKTIKKYEDDGWTVLKEANMDVFKKHQEKIAKDTLKMTAPMVAVMGGMTKKEAIDFLKSIGYTDTQIKKLSK